MARLQTHHIRYDINWTVELNSQMHNVITIVQRTRATEQQYVILTNFMHAITEEWNRMRAELDVKQDLRIKK